MKLNSGVMKSLRDIGTSFRNLKILKALKVGLEQLEGISSFPAITELYIAFNCISSLSPLIYNDTLEILDLEGNEITEIDEVLYLDMCSSLFSLTLEGNPVAGVSGYREVVFGAIG
jgi:Leucine-rich repeat (LRR) protein